MKKIILIITLTILFVAGKSQDFAKNVQTARQSYANGKLEDTHFALQQMLVELDMTIGKEILKLMPAKMDTMKLNSRDDNVSANVGFIGATVRRTYGIGDRRVEVNIISNSPMVATLNALLTSPLMKFAGSDNKSIKVQGYKGRITKEGSDDEKAGYKLEIPFNSALVTISASMSSEVELTNMANTIPFAEIAKLIQ